MPNDSRLDAMQRKLDDMERRLQISEQANEEFRRWITDRRKHFEPREVEPNDR